MAASSWGRYSALGKRLVVEPCTLVLVSLDELDSDKPITTKTLSKLDEFSCLAHTLEQPSPYRLRNGRR